MEIKFKDGIPGFEEYKTYRLEICEEEDNPFHRLQSLEEAELSFIIVNPFLIKEDYDFNLTENTIEKLDIKEQKDLLVYTIVTIPDEKIENMTINLLAPIIINRNNNLAKQIILSDTNYTTKHKIIGSGE